MRLVILLALGCSSTDSSSKPDDADSGGAASHIPTGTDSDDTGAIPSDDTASTDPPTPSECEAPQLHLVGEFVSTELHPIDAPPAPLVLGSCGWGLAVLDVNSDGWPDLIPAGAWASTRVLLNDAGVLRPSDTVAFDGGLLPMANGLATGDVDGDGRVDLVHLTGTGTSDRIYLNRGTGTFESVELADSALESQSASLFDADADGDLDLFIARHIDGEATVLPDLEAGVLLGDKNAFYLNEGGTMVPAAVPGNSRAASFQGVPFDADGDGDLDLFVVNDFGAFIHSSELLLNDAGVFSVAEDCQCDGAKFGMGGAVGDVDADGIPDIHVTNFGTPELLMGMGDGRYYESALARGLSVGPDRVTGWGASFLDLNMDGHADLVSAFGPVLVGMEGDWSDMVEHDVVAGIDDLPDQPSALWMNDGEGFIEYSSLVGLDASGVTRSVVVADFNRDGLPDIATSGLLPNRHQVVRVYESKGGCGPGVVVDFPSMSAADLGAKVEWTVNGEMRTAWMVPGTTFSSSGSTMHLGLGGHDQADSVRVTPVNGEPIDYRDVPRGTVLDQRSYQ